MTLGEKIRHLRTERGWSQTDLAKMIGVSKQRVSKYETNINNPVFEVLIQLSKAFGVSVDYLIFNSINELTSEDTELIKCFQKIEKLSYERRKFIKEFIKTYLLMPEDIPLKEK